MDKTAIAKLIGLDNNSSVDEIATRRNDLLAFFAGTATDPILELIVRTASEKVEDLDVSGLGGSVSHGEGLGSSSGSKGTEETINIDKLLADLAALPLVRFLPRLLLPACSWGLVFFLAHGPLHQQTIDQGWKALKEDHPEDAKHWLWFAGDGSDMEALRLKLAIDRKEGKAAELSKGGNSLHQSPPEPAALPPGQTIAGARQGYTPEQTQKAIEARTDAGISKLKEGNYDGAETWFGSALDLDPDYSPALLGRSAVRIRLKQYGKANNDFDHACRLNDRSNPDQLAESYYLLGWAWLDNGDRNVAKSLFLKSRNISASFPDASNAYLRISQINQGIEPQAGQSIPILVTPTEQRQHHFGQPDYGTSSGGYIEDSQRGQPGNQTPDLRLQNAPSQGDNWGYVPRQRTSPSTDDGSYSGLNEQVR